MALIYLAAVFLVLGIAVIVMVIKQSKGEMAIESDPKYDFIEVEDPDNTFKNSVDVYLYVDGCYHSMTLVWQKENGLWKYGGSRPWAAYATTKQSAIEMSKRRLIHDAQNELKTKKEQQL